MLLRGRVHLLEMVGMQALRWMFVCWRQALPLVWIVGIRGVHCVFSWGI